jgi:ADP-heptose:LPS heptosyltransferase
VDLALDFQGLLRSGLMSRASGAGAVVGMSDSREGARWFHGHVVPVRAGAHAVERNLAGELRARQAARLAGRTEVVP